MNLAFRPSPAWTPWGQADNEADHAAGIVSYSTPSHGGIHLSEARLAAMPSALSSIKPLAGRGWYEEDCDWCLPVLAFPECFSDREVKAALETFRTWHWRHLAFLTSPEGKALVQRVAHITLEAAAHGTR